MILAPFLSSGATIWHEQVLVIVDCIIYCIVAVIATQFAPGLHTEGGDGGAMGSLGIYLIVSTALTAWRHIKMARAAIHREDSYDGLNKKPPVTIPIEEATPNRASILYFVPVALQTVSLIWLFIDPQCPNTRAILLMLIASESHYALSRGHGDHNGGKFVPTLFAIMFHLAAALSGTPPHITVSIHRVLAIFTYFFTGFRKLYCTGIRWADGINLQLMIGLQGDYDSDPDNDNDINYNDNNDFDRDNYNKYNIMYHDVDHRSLS